MKRFKDIRKGDSFITDGGEFSEAGRHTWHVQIKHRKTKELTVWRVTCVGEHKHRAGRQYGVICHRFRIGELNRYVRPTWLERAI